jgi:hypothetical protein
MNSLTFVSHHFFVAAIGNEGRVHERPTRQERPSVGTAGLESAIAIEVMDRRKPLPATTVRPLRTSVAQVGN